jgi:hypothetical protein
MSAWLLDKCIAYAKAHRHPELTEQTIWECQLAWSSYSDRDWQPVQNNAFTGGTTGNATAACLGVRLTLRQTRARKSDHGWRTVERTSS